MNIKELETVVQNEMSEREKQISYINAYIQCELNNRMGKTRDLFKKIRDT